MKLRSITPLILALFTHSIGNADVLSKQGYALGCWDGTFAYNELSVETQGDQLQFTSSGQDLGIYRNLVKSVSEASWGQLKISFSIPAQSCKISKSDSKVMTCQSPALTITATGTAGSSNKIEETIGLTKAVIQLRRVEEVSIWGNDTKGYELIISKNQIQSVPVLAQRYFYGLMEDESANCNTNH